MTAFETYPPKNLNTKFVVHAHFRKERSVHLDIRIQFDTKALVGYTLTNPFSVYAPFDSFEGASQIVLDNRIVLEKRLNNPDDKFLAIPKEIQPAVWLTVSGEVEPKEIGGTRFGKGAFVIVDSGLVEFGRLSTFFREYWFHGKIFNGRFVARLIPGERLSDPETEKRSKTALVWLFWKTLTPSPFVLSKKAILQGYIPPYGISAMQKETVSIIPTKFRFWHSKNKFKRIEIRNKLAESNLIKLNESVVVNRTRSMADEAGGFYFIIQSFKGQFVIRFGASRTIFHLFLTPNLSNRSHHYVSISDISSSEQSALLQYEDVKEILVKGPVDIGSYFNPTKNTDSFAEIISKGKYWYWHTDMGSDLIEFASDKLSGRYKLRHETTNSDILLLEKETTS